MTQTRQSRVRALLASAIVAACASPTFAGLGDGSTPSDPGSVFPHYLLQDTQPAGSQPATDPVSAMALEVKVVEVKGSVMASTDDGKTYKKVAVGEAFGMGTVFRTGLRSGVTCKVGADQMFTLESLTTLRVEEAIRAGGKEKTDLLMKYGAASYGIEAAGREYDAVIRTPGSTMAIRGTVVRVYDRAGFSPQAESYTGRALFRTARGATFIGGRGYSVASGVKGSAAETALSNSTVDPSIAAARTQNESQVISEQLSAGGVLGFDNRASIPVVRGGGPLPDSSLPGALPGRLSFALRWDGPADLNFILDNQAGDSTQIVLSGFRPEEILFPGYGLNTSLSGGIIPYDHRGGKNGGTEIGYWQENFPKGVYGVGVLHASGGTTDFKINAYLDGEALPIFTFDEEGNVVRVNTLKGTVGPDGTDGAILFVPRNELFESIAQPGDDDVTTQAIARSLSAIKNGGAPTKMPPALTKGFHNNQAIGPVSKALAESRAAEAKSVAKQAKPGEGRKAQKLGAKGR